VAGLPRGDNRYSRDGVNGTGLSICDLDVAGYYACIDWNWFLEELKSIFFFNLPADEFADNYFIDYTEFLFD